jgi:predicted HAD superfamily phosphohydrolase YqeG
MHARSTFRPTYLGPLVAVTPEWCQQEGIESYGVDLDGHLLDFKASADEIERPQRLAVAALLSAGVDEFILSNTANDSSRKKRPFEVAETLGIQTERVFGTFSLDPERPKPHTATLEHAIALGGFDKAATLYGGDQQFKDIAVANRAGIRSLLSSRLGPNDHIGVKLAQRPLEFAVRATWRLPLGTDTSEAPLLAANYPQNKIIRVSPNPSNPSV